VTAGPTTHERAKGTQLGNDVTLRNTRDGRAESFVHVEVQGKYTSAKFLALRAYHGSEVLKNGTGGTMVVLSHNAETAAQFRAAEAAGGQELAYRGVYLSGADLADMAGPDRPFEERALVAALASYTKGIPPEVHPLLQEMDDRDPVMAELFWEVMLDECPTDDKRLEEEMFSPETYQRMHQMPVFQRYFDKLEAKGKTEGKAEGKAEGKVAEAIEALFQFFKARGDEISLNADVEIETCTDVETLHGWRDRAYRGETAEQIFDRVAA
jgi:hypothetical protein